jgi:hypothetical protein
LGAATFVGVGLVRCEREGDIADERGSAPGSRPSCRLAFMVSGLTLIAAPGFGRGGFAAVCPRLVEGGVRGGAGAAAVKGDGEVGSGAQGPHTGGAVEGGQKVNQLAVDGHGLIRVAGRGEHRGVDLDRSHPWGSVRGNRVGLARYAQVARSRARPSPPVPARPCANTVAASTTSPVRTAASRWDNGPYRTATTAARYRR